MSDEGTVKPPMPYAHGVSLVGPNGQYRAGEHGSRTRESNRAFLVENKVSFPNIDDAAPTTSVGKTEDIAGYRTGHKMVGVAGVAPTLAAF
jgi:hypothetical protein